MVSYLLTKYTVVDLKNQPTCPVVMTLTVSDAIPSAVVDSQVPLSRETLCTNRENVALNVGMLRVCQWRYCEKNERAYSR
jgi:hypothetical protein